MQPEPPTKPTLNERLSFAKSRIASLEYDIALRKRMIGHKRKRTWEHVGLEADERNLTEWRQTVDDITADYANPIPDDGFADGGTPYTEEEMDIINPPTERPT